MNVDPIEVAETLLDVGIRKTDFPNVLLFPYSTGILVTGALGKKFPCIQNDGVILAIIQNVVDAVSTLGVTYATFEIAMQTAFTDINQKFTSDAYKLIIAQICGNVVKYAQGVLGVDLDLHEYMEAVREIGADISLLRLHDMDSPLFHRELQTTKEYAEHRKTVESFTFDGYRIMFPVDFEAARARLEPI